MNGTTATLETERDTVSPPTLPTQDQGDTVSRPGTDVHGNRIVPASVWAEACEEYVAGRLRTLADVARRLKLSPNRVHIVARKQRWTELRAGRAAQLMAKTEQGPEWQSVLDKLKPEQLRDAQRVLADAVLAHGSNLLKSIDESLTGLVLTRQTLTALGPDDSAGDKLCARLASLTAHHVALLGQIRLLAGIPDPDKAPAVAKPAQGQGKAGSKAKEEQAQPPRRPGSVSPLGLAKTREKVPNGDGFGDVFVEEPEADPGQTRPHGGGGGGPNRPGED